MPTYKRRTKIQRNVRCGMCGDRIPCAVTTATGAAICARCRDPQSPTCGKPSADDVELDDPLDAALKALEDAE